MIHEARIALPPIHGAKLNCAVIVASAPSAGAFAMISAVTHFAFSTRDPLSRHSSASAAIDHGPVQAATTISSTTNGIHACNTSAVLRPWPLLCDSNAGIDRHAAVREHVLWLPELEQGQQRDEADDRAGHVGQIRSEVHSDRILSGDVAERADDRQRPRTQHALLAGNQIQQHPGRQQCQHGDDGADRAGQRQQRIAGDRGQAR